MEDLIRSVLAAHGRLAVDASSISEDDDLYRVGLTSHATVSVMLALEEHLGVELPDHLLQRQTFSSIRSIRSALGEASANSGAA
jgi:acyl carrier protein